MFQMIQ